MKKNILCVLLLSFILIPALGQNRVIDIPGYEVKNTGIDNIIKIELSDKTTRIHVKTTFIPNWWVKFPKTTFIKVEGSDEKILATGIENGEFDKEIFMPASGDSLFVLIFPPLDKSVKKIDYGREEKPIIFGICLEENKQKAEKTQKTIPAHVEIWLKDELKNAKTKKELPSYQSEHFFSTQNARLVGYIKGYDPRLGFSTGIIYARNDITREDYPVTADIHPDGRFEANIPLQYPINQYISIKEKPIGFYIEPGQTLEMVLDWEDFLTADRLRNISYRFENIEFEGALAKINRELLDIEIKMDVWNEKEKKKKSMTPDEYKNDQQQLLNENLKMIHQKQTEQSLSEKSGVILTNSALLEYGTNLIEYVSDRKWALREDSTNQILKLPIPDNYYDFLQKIPMNDQALLIPSSSSTFLNRFEYCDAFSDAQRYSFGTPDITIWEYLEKEHKNTLTDEDEKVKKIQEQFESLSDEKEKEQLINNNMGLFEEFNIRHKPELELYGKYIEKQFEKYRKDQFLKEIQSTDSILVNVLHLSKPNLVYDITKIRSLKFKFENLPDREDGETVLSAIIGNIQNPFIKSEGIRIFNHAFPENNKTTYDLPDTEAGKLFKEMTTPLKGKYVIADFWESWCGPCVAGIKQNKELRKKLKGSSDIAFLFICSEDTQENTYNEYVNEQGLENSYRLTKDQYNRMRELFKFNGIPHYEYINREGKIMTKGLDIYNLTESLNNLLKEE